MSVHDNMRLNRKASLASDELTALIKAMADRYGRPAVLAGIEHAVGTYCDEIGGNHKFYMAAGIAGMDRDAMVRQARAKSAGLIIPG